MLCRVIREFTRKGNLQRVGWFLNIPDTMLLSMADYVEPIKRLETCQALKTNGCICGHPLKEGLNGFRCCSDPGCQVPEYNHTTETQGIQTR